MPELGSLGSVRGAQGYLRPYRDTVIYLQDFEEEVWAPACGFSAQLDASLGLVGTHEIEGETADDCHVLGPVAGSVARQVVLEGDVEEPVEAFDGPMAAGRLGEPVRCRAALN